MKYDIYNGVRKIKTKATAAITGAALGFSGLAMAIAVPLGVSAANGYSLFGEASIVSGGNPGKAVKMVSDLAPGYGGVDYAIPAGTTFADLTTLSTDYKFENDDSCGGGSPRFQINVDDPNSTDEGNIFVYIGPPPSYTACPPNVWLNSGDLLEGVNPIDTSQLDAGTFYDPYAAALLKYGDYVVTGIQVVTDASWLFPDGEQTSFVDNTNVDGVVYTYDQPSSKDECKKGGWMDLTDQNGDPFKNQGQCVSWTNGRGQ